jgi:hypothetical protein
MEDLAERVRLFFDAHLKDERRADEERGAPETADRPAAR